MKNGRSLVDLANELSRQLHTKRDMLVPSQLMRFSTDASGVSKMNIEAPDGHAAYGITDLAKRQLADKLAIPYAYFERMRSNHPSLLDQNVNTWLHGDPDRRLVRTLDGRVRALLSDRYRRLDNYDLADHVLPILTRLPGARVESAEITETRMYLKVVTSRIEHENQPGDVVQAGVVVSNSEVGCGSLSVQPLIYRLICRNGLIAADHALRKTHVGRSKEAAEDAITVFKDDTLQAEDKAFFLRVRDVVESAVSETTFRQLADRMRRTLNIALAADPVKSVEVLATKYLLNEEERNGVLRHLISGGDLSGYGLVNAVTHFSQEVVDYDRATEFEVMGGKLIDLPAREWNELALAA